MKAKHSVWKTKLVKSMSLFTAILIAALFLGSAAGAGIAQNSSATINTKNIDQNINTNAKLQSPFKASIGLQGTPSEKNERLQKISQPTPLNPLEQVIRFNDGTYYTGVGLTSGGTFEGAIRITPTEQSGYTGYGLIAVSWYHYGAMTHAGNIKIYASGTPTEPGTLLQTVPFSVTGDGMKRIDLTSSVDLPITADMWVSVEVTHAAGEFPLGCDNGPAIDGKGDMVFLPPGPWTELQIAAPTLDYNWMIDAVIDITTQYEHDVGVQEIVKPTSGVGSAFTPEVKVKNFGLNDETAVPVNLKITRYDYTTLLEQHFDGTFPPAGWTRTNTKWQQSSTANAGGTAPEATFYYSPSETGTFRLYTGAIDTTGYSALSLTFRSMVNHYTTPYTLKVETSTDAVTWNTAWSISPTGSIPAHIETIPLTDGVGSSTFYISWTFEGYSYNINYWYIDDCLIQLVNPVEEYNETVLIDINSGVQQNVLFPNWLPDDLGVSENVNVDYKVEAQTMLVGDNNTDNDYKTNMITLHFGYFHDIAVNGIVEPVDGTAEVFHPTVTVTNVGQNDETSVPINLVISKPYMAQHFTGTFLPTDWTQEGVGEWMQSFTTNAGGTSPEARLYYANIVGNYAYLDSPAFDTTGVTTLKLDFRNYIQNQYGGTYCKVLSRSDAGDTWTDITPWSNPINANVPQAKYTIDISGDVGTATQIRFEFSGTSAGLYYWYLDDVTILQTDFTEYDQTVYVDLTSGEVMDVIFTPDWTPSDLGTAENADIEYLMLAEAQLGTDGNAANDLLGKALTLHYPFFDDVAVTQIIEPTDGLAQIQPVKVALANNGQNDESGEVTVVIEKFNGTAENFEGSDGGFVRSGT
ncbi:MAG TPA: hypothetical protein VN377_02070, partial [Candidatus Thermoplasmatota archaeon]|nr:hypothetical protein [Candidatus Thermoplasmatota archaeon]